MDRFAVFLRASGRSAATMRAYCAVVNRWLAFESPAIGDGRLLRYLASRRECVAPASVDLEVSALRAWFGWLKIADPDAWRPAAFPRTKRRKPRRVVRALTDGEVGLLLGAPDLTTFVGLRDHFLMATLYQCGLRASEAASLELGSVRIDGYLYVRGKGGHGRLVPYGGAWAGLLDGYLKARRTVRPGKRAALFLTRRGHPLRDGRSVWVIVNRYARRALGAGCGYARLDRTIRGSPWQGHYPHLLRASFATELHRNGCNIHAVSQMLGHANLETTAHYLGVDLSQLQAAAARHPRAKRRAD